MKKILLISVFLFVSSVVFAGSLGVSSGLSGSENKGIQTIINNNVQKEKPDPDLQANEDKAYKESKLTLFFEAAPYVFPFGYTMRQFSQSTYAIGAMWKVDEHWHGLVKYMNYDIKGPDGENYTALHYMYGIGMRWTVSQDHQVQLNIGSSSSEVNWIDGSYEMPVFGEAKYLWCSDNTAYGFVMGVMDMPKKHKEGDRYENAGFMYVSLTFEVGLPDF